jgi:hypothetical protein
MTHGTLSRGNALVAGALRAIRQEPERQGGFRGAANNALQALLPCLNVEGIGLFLLDEPEQSLLLLGAAGAIGSSCTEDVVMRSAACGVVFVGAIRRKRIDEVDSL